LPSAGGPLSTLSDVELLQRITTQAAAGDGESAALAALYDRYIVSLLTLAERLLGTRSDAEDLVHDLFIEVWLRAATYDPQRASVRTWLLLRLRSRALDRLKSAAWRLAMSSTPLRGSGADPLSDQGAGELVSSSDPDLDLALRATQATVRSAVRLLTQEEQQLIDLVYVRGISLSEAAEHLDAPLGTVKSRLNRVLGKLRSSLTQAPYEV
jgi:RNA polymerase sigma-70 factor (ECF subfamily)